MKSFERSHELRSQDGSKTPAHAERSHECEVCAEEHVHTVYRYTFDDEDLEPKREYTKGPVTLHVDRYHDWFVSVEHGYTKVDQTWDADAGAILVDVVEKQEEI